MNVKLLRKVAKHILDEPKRFYMSTLIHEAAPGTIVNLDNIPHEIPACGTAACIAGWTCILAGTPKIDRVDADRELRLTSSQGDSLYFVGNWPEKFLAKWQATVDLQQRAKIANSRINHLIKTGQ